jgi:hypothetical protein
MAECCLDEVEGGAVVEGVRGVGVTEPVRRDGQVDSGEGGGFAEVEELAPDDCGKTDRRGWCRLFRTR